MGVAVVARCNGAWDACDHSTLERLPGFGDLTGKEEVPRAVSTGRGDLDAVACRRRRGWIGTTHVASELAEAVPCNHESLQAVDGGEMVVVEGSEGACEVLTWSR